MRKLVGVAVVLLGLGVAAGDAGTLQKRLQEGDSAMNLGDFTSARKAYQEALAAEPSSTVALVRLGWVESRDGNWDEAVKHLESALGRPDAPPEAWQILGETRARQQEWARAADAYQRYLEKKPADVMTRLELARALAALAETDAAARTRAQAEYQRVLADAKGDDALAAQVKEELFALRYGPLGKDFREGKSAIESGDFRAAISKLEPVTQKVPELEEAHYLLGVAYSSVEIGRRADAARVWERAPSMPEAHVALGIQLHDGGDLRNAEARFLRAVALSPRFQEGWYHLGELYAEKGDMAAAEKAWQKAIDVDGASDLGRWAKTRKGAATGEVIEPFEEGQVVDPATELIIGRRIIDAIGAHRGFVEDERLLERLDKIFQRLVVATDRGDLTYKLYIYKDPLPNAYALPGGHILLPTGMIDMIRLRLGDKDEYYAALLGHELAHAALRHSPEGLRLQQARKDLSAPELRRVMAELTIRATRQQEYEADKYGALYMYRAGMNPKYMLDFWARAPKVFGPSRPGGDHATHEERAARMRDALIELRGRVGELERGNKALRAGDHAAAQRHYEVFLAVLPRSAAARVNYALALHREGVARLGSDAKWRKATDLDPDARLAKVEVHSTTPGAEVDPRVKLRRLREAEAAYRIALQLDPGHLIARINYGALLSDMGEPKRALPLLEDATRRAPKHAGAWTNLGVVYAQLKDKRAEKALVTATKLDDKAAEPWFDLGILHADAGRKDAAAKAFDEAIKRDGASPWAKAARQRKAALP